MTTAVARSLVPVVTRISPRGSRSAIPVGTQRRNCQTPPRKIRYRMTAFSPLFRARAERLKVAYCYLSDLWTVEDIVAQFKAQFVAQNGNFDRR